MKKIVIHKKFEVRKLAWEMGGKIIYKKKNLIGKSM